MLSMCFPASDPGKTAASPPLLLAAAAALGPKLSGDPRGPSRPGHWIHWIPWEIPWAADDFQSWDMEILR